MRSPLSAKLEAARLRTGRMASSQDDGGYGMFRIDGPCGKILQIIASGADAEDTLSQGWEHVSVSCNGRIPNWREMCFVKNLFWNPEDCVVQFHPPQSEYVNNHEFCLHLWRHKTQPFPLPPSILVGVKGAGVLSEKSAEKIQIFLEVIGHR